MDYQYIPWRYVENKESNNYCDECCKYGDDAYYDLELGEWISECDRCPYF